MNIVLLIDNGDGNVLDVLISEKTTEDEIRAIASEVIEKKEGTWTLEDIYDALPDDVEIKGYEKILV